jgi:hypothetical protein
LALSDSGQPLQDIAHVAVWLDTVATAILNDRVPVTTLRLSRLIATAETPPVVSPQHDGVSSRIFCPQIPEPRLIVHDSGRPPTGLPSHRPSFTVALSKPSCSFPDSHRGTNLLSFPLLIPRPPTHNLYEEPPYDQVASARVLHFHARRF